MSGKSALSQAPPIRVLHAVSPSAPDTDVVQVDAHGQVITAKLNLFQRVVLYFKGAHEAVTRAFLAELHAAHDSESLRISAGIAPQALNLARGRDAAAAFDRRTPLTVRQVRTAQGIAQRLKDQKTHSSLTALAMDYSPFVVGPESTLTWPGFQSIARRLGVTPQNFDAHRSELYCSLLIQRMKASQPADIATVPQREKIALDTLQYVRGLDEQQVGEATAARGHGVGALQSLAENLAGADPHSVARALRNFHLAACECLPQATLGRALAPNDANLRSSRALILADVIGILPVSKALGIYKAAMAEGGSGRALLFASYVNETQLAARAGSLHGRSLSTAAVPDAVSKAAHDLRESVYEVIQALGLRACLDPQQVAADLAKLTRLATSADERIARPAPAAARTMHYDGLSFKEVKQIRTELRDADLKSEGRAAAFVGSLRLQSGVAEQMLREKSPARSPQDARPPPAGPESELAAQDRAAAESAQETATQESGSGSIEDDGGALARALDAIGQPQLDSSGLEDGAVPAAFLAALERQQIAVKIAGADVKVATADALDAADAPPPEQHSGEAGSSSADIAEDLFDFVILDAASTPVPAEPLQSEPNPDQAEPPVGTPSSVAGNALGLLSQYLGSRALAQRLSRLLHAGIVDVLRTHVTDHDSGLARFLSEQSAARAGGLDRAQFGAVVSYQGQDAARVDVHCRLLGPLPASQPAGAAESAGLGPPSLDLKVSFLIPQQGPIAVISPLLYEYHAA